MDIYVGNLSYDITAEELREAFEQHGEVTTAKIVSDRETGRSKGFGFVEMPSQAEGEAAIAELNGAMLKGRTARVNEARPREARPPRRCRPAPAPARPYPALPRRRISLTPPTAALAAVHRVQRPSMAGLTSSMTRRV